MNIKHAFKPLPALAFVLLSSTTALAADGDAFASRLKELLAEQGIELNYSSVENAGDNVTLRAVTLSADENSGSIGDLTFENVTGTREEGFHAERMPVADINMLEDGNRLIADGIVVEGISVAGTNVGSAALVSPVQIEHAGFNNVVLQVAGRDAVTFGETRFDSTPAADGGFSGTFNVKSFVVDTEAMQGPEGGSQALKQLGFEKISGTMNGNGAWKPENGELTLEPLTLDVENAGKLDFAYKVTGYTPAFVQQLTELQKSMATNPEGDEQAGIAMLGLFSQLYVDNAKLAFTDNSLTNKLLDYFADSNGITRDQLIGGLTAALPAYLSYIENEAFRAKVQDAVTSYLSAPENITIAVAPQSPVSAAQILSAGMGAPQTLPDVLKLEVLSNQ